ncbi:MAG TPA: hypothetical protein VN843_22395 [Anaerolineales bacterium]|nr:hypothetical protein [Anaerolineales bacterium]
MLIVLWGKERQANTRQVNHRKSLRFVGGEWWAPLEVNATPLAVVRHR